MAYPQSWSCPACGNTVYNSEQCTICTYKPKTVTTEVRKQNQKVTGDNKLLIKRLLAFIIDSLIILGISFFVILGFIATIYEGVNKDFFIILLAFIVPLSIIPILMHPAYHLFFEGKYSGLTYGKKLMKIRVKRLDNEYIGWKESIIRNSIRLLEMITLYVISLVFVIITKGEQRLGDKVAGTIMVME